MNIRWVLALGCALVFLSMGCEKPGGTVGPSFPEVTPPPVVTGSILNASHLEKLAVAVTFPNGEKGEGIYVYADAPNYTPTPAGSEGFTCVDDVARVVLFYLRSTTFSSDTLVQKKVFGMLRFLVNMQSDNGYFYNFLQSGNVINKSGITSIDQPKWWSWRALQALTEAVPVIWSKNAVLADRIDYIRKLANGIILTQLGSANHFPYSCFLSSGNSWHAYGSDQATALFQTGAFLNDTTYSKKAMAEVNNFYPWLINNGFKNSFDVVPVNNEFMAENSKEFEQIAYGIRPMVFAAIDAYVITNDEKYADMAGRLAAWFLGKNSAAAVMFSITTGRCYDAINTGNSVNRNSGAESTIEALLTMQRVNKYPTVKAAMDKYKNN